MQKNKLIDATKAYHIAIQLNPKYAAAYNNLGNSFYRQGKIKNAIKSYQKSIVLHPNFPNAHFNYGRLLAELEDYDQAIIELTKATASNTHAPALGQLAHIYLIQKDYHKAVIHFNQRLNLQPNHAETHHDLGIALLKLNHFTEAAHHFKKSLDLNPDHTEVHYHLATAYLQLGEHEKALNHYLQQIEKQAHLESYYNIGVLLMYQERHLDAIDYFNKALEIKGDYLEAYLNIAAIYLKMGRMQEAIKHYQQALKIKPKDAEIQHILKALQQKETPTNAPKTYIEHLFDQYALYYDQHLTKHLDYHVPQLLYDTIDTEINVEPPQWKILDLGCGTGLCGHYFKDMSKTLIGVDLSQKMLDIAEQKNIYNTLELNDISEALNHYHGVDLILAADVFTYIGDLSEIFKEAKQALSENGLFAFTVEKSLIEPYQLQQTIRYAHSQKYIDALIKENDFITICQNNIVLRKQKGKPVEGYLVVLRNRT